jgi:hypothetical protein
MHAMKNKILVLSVFIVALCLTMTCFKDQIANPQSGALVLNVSFPPESGLSPEVETPEGRQSISGRKAFAKDDALFDERREIGTAHTLLKPSITYLYVKAVIVFNSERESLYLQKNGDNQYVGKRDVPAGKIDSIIVKAYAQDSTLVAEKSIADIIITADKSEPINLILAFVKGVERSLEIEIPTRTTVPVSFDSPPPITARVLDAMEKGVGDRPVTFSIESGDAFFSTNEYETTRVTNKEGEATAFWKVGANPGKILFAVSATDRSDSVLYGSPASIEFEALPRGIADSLTSCSFTDWSGNICDTLNEPLCALVLDAAGDGAPFVPVAFSILNNKASFANGDTGITVQTNEEGKAYAKVTVGSDQGEIKFRVAAVDDSDANLQGSPLEFDVGISADRIADSLKYVSGDGQTIIQNDTLPEPIQIRAVDHSGDAVPDWRTLWRIDSGPVVFLNGLDSAVVHTNVEGRAAATIRATGEGSIEISVSADNKCGVLNGSPLRILATAHALPMDTLKILQGPGFSASACDTLPEPILIQRVNAMGRGVAGAAATMRILSGKAVFPNFETVETLATNADGMAKTNLQIELHHGQIPIQVQSLDFDGRHIIGSPDTFNVAGNAAGIVAILRILAGDGQSGYTNDTLFVPLMVQALDLLQNPLAERSILFRVASTNARFSTGDDQADVVTDQNGRAAVYLILGDSPGSVSVEASIVNACDSTLSVEFEEMILARPEPTILALEPPIAATNDTVEIHGQHFSFGVTAVRFGADLRPSPSFRTVGDTLIYAVAPNGVRSGSVEVQTTAGISYTSPPFYALALEGELELPQVSQLVDMRAENVGKKLYIADTAAVIFQMESMPSPDIRTIYVDSLNDIATFEIVPTGEQYDELLIYSNRAGGELALIRSDNSAILRQQGFGHEDVIHKIYSFYSGNSFLLFSGTQFIQYNRNNIEQDYQSVAQFSSFEPLRAVFTDNDMVYITLNGSDNVEYYKLMGNQQAIQYSGSVSDGFQLYDIVTDSDEEYAYFTCIKDGRINILDLSQHNAIYFQPNFAPRCLSIGQNDRFLLVGGNSGNTISIIDLWDNNRTVKQFDIGGRPDIIKYLDLPDGRFFYALDKTSSRISRFAIIN